MIPDLGKYAVTVLSAYGASLALLLAIVAASWQGARASRRRLAEAERRRSAHG